MIVGGLFSIVALFTGTTSQVVILSVMGAVLMYMMSMISLFILRVKEPGLERPFASPFYPVFPALASLLLVITAIAIIYYYPKLSLIFFAGLVLALIVFIMMGKHKVKITNDVLLATAPINNPVTS